MAALLLRSINLLHIHLIFLYITTLYVNAKVGTIKSTRALQTTETATKTSTCKCYCIGRLQSSDQFTQFNQNPNNIFCELTNAYTQGVFMCVYQSFCDVQFIASVDEFYHLKHSHAFPNTQDEVKLSLIGKKFTKVPISGVRVNVFVDDDRSYIHLQDCRQLTNNKSQNPKRLQSKNYIIDSEILEKASKSLHQSERFGYYLRVFAPGNYVHYLLDNIMMMYLRLYSYGSNDGYNILSSNNDGTFYNNSIVTSTSRHGNITQQQLQKPSFSPVTLVTDAESINPMSQILNKFIDFHKVYVWEEMQTLVRFDKLVLGTWQLSGIESKASRWNTSTEQFDLFRHFIFSRLKTINKSNRTLGHDVFMTRKGFECNRQVKPHEQIILFQNRLDSKSRYITAESLQNVLEQAKNVLHKTNYPVCYLSSTKDISPFDQLSIFRRSVFVFMPFGAVCANIIAAAKGAVIVMIRPRAYTAKIEPYCRRVIGLLHPTHHVQEVNLQLNSIDSVALSENTDRGMKDCSADFYGNCTTHCCYDTISFRTAGIRLPPDTTAAVVSLLTHLFIEKKPAIQFHTISSVNFTMSVVSPELFRKALLKERPHGGWE